MGELYSYFKKIEIWNVMNNLDIHRLTQTVSEMYANEPHLSQKLSHLLNVCDTKIASTLIRERDNSEFQWPPDLPKQIQHDIITQHKYSVKTIHQLAPEIMSLYHSTLS